MLLLAIVPTAVVLAVGGGVGLWYARSRVDRPGSGPADRLATPFGRPGGALLTVAAGTGVVLAICWPLGWVARHSGALDRRVLRYVAPRAHEHQLVQVMRELTKMGNNREMQVFTAVTAVALSLLWLRRQRGWLALAPGVLMLVAYELEHQLQHVLKLLAHRGHPPTSLGTYPSGGCARLICIVGLALYLLLRYLGATRSKGAVAAWTVLAAASYVEGFSRVYLSKHWFTDVVGGWVFGVLLLAVLIVCAQVLLPGASASTDRRAVPGRRAEPAAPVLTS